ncbi:MAG TPA: DUF5615 family PIN-like protein [Blastocatellia bacterium]|jgi:hypothetical protein|nr:DUF5615 family PIN-like protein [Blastocatellia bacterium]
MRLLADENFDNRILRGLRRRLPNLDIVRVQDIGLSGKSDSELLDWCASESRILLTHDVSTVKPLVVERILRSLPMPGVFEMNQGIAIAEAIEELVVLVECSIEGEWDGQIRFLPLR